MKLDAPTYFEHLKAYINDDYIMHEGIGGKVILKEKYYVPDDVKPKERKIELLLSGPGLAFKLDHDAFETSKKKSKPALFHFLDDTAKPWSKRCDFVIFYVNQRIFQADCIEFKSKSLSTDKIVPQLHAGACWVYALMHTIQRYTGYKRNIQLRKFVFGENENPNAYLDRNRQLIADPSIRYYHFDEVQGKLLAELHNTSVQKI